MERGQRGREPLGSRSVGASVVPLTGRDVHGRVLAEVAFSVPRHGEETVVGSAQDPVLDDRAGRDDARHFASDEPFREPRVLDLVAEGDLEPLADEASQVGFDRVVGNARHRGADPLGVGRPSGQDDVHGPGEHPGVVPERLVEIPYPEEDQVAGIAGLDPLVLLHERCGGGRFGHDPVGERDRPYNRDRGSLERRGGPAGDPGK